MICAGKGDLSQMTKDVREKQTAERGFQKGPVCVDSRECFAKHGAFGTYYCSVLRETYSDGKCPFCKPKAGKIHEIW